jgi:hypothetical protein
LPWIPNRRDQQFGISQRASHRNLSSETISNLETRFKIQVSQKKPKENGHFCYFFGNEKSKQENLHSFPYICTVIRKI